MSRIRIIANALQTRYARFCLAVVATVSLLATPALAGAQTAPTNYDLSPAVAGVGAQITSILVVVLPVAGGLIALFVGWKLLKRMVKGA